MNAPTGRNASVSVIESAIALSVLAELLARSPSARTTTRKKSNASSVQPRKLAATAARWPLAAGGGSVDWSRWVTVLRSGQADAGESQRRTNGATNATRAAPKMSPWAPPSLALTRRKPALPSPALLHHHVVRDVDVEVVVHAEARSGRSRRVIPLREIACTCVLFTRKRTESGADLDREIVAGVRRVVELWIAGLAVQSTSLVDVRARRGG